MIVRLLHLNIGLAALVVASLTGGCAHNPQASPSGSAAGGRVRADSSGRDAKGLRGTSWRLEDLGGAGVLDDAEATLEFPEAGKVAGRGSCNRFFGKVETAGDSIRFGPIGSTRMACAEAVGIQEGKYLKALAGAERFAVDGATLLVYSRAMDKPLRFTRAAP
ncbi:MAG: META domain-containing protein [Gemmatimonadales bacterium]